MAQLGVESVFSAMFDPLIGARHMQICSKRGLNATKNMAEKTTTAIQGPRETHFIAAHVSFSSPRPSWKGQIEAAKSSFPMSDD